jgi:hypothetical protein
MDYLSLLAEADAEAREDYVYKPETEVYIDTNSNASIEEETQNEIQVEPESVIDSLAVPVQNQPEMSLQRHVVIIDTAQRDWTIQPNAYSNTFSFGLQNATPTVTGKNQIPYYYNNPTIPYSAYEMPTLASDKGQYPNTSPRIIPGTVGETFGWRLVTNTTTGNLVHSDVVPESALSSGYSIVYFPVYDPAETKGARIGVDSHTVNSVSNAYPFATQLHLSNVHSMRLVHCVLPVRSFDSYNADIFLTSSGAFTALNTNVLDSFYTEPYVVMTIENMKGAYYGANQVIQNAFAAMVQQSRNQYSADARDIIAQYMDFYPWSLESYVFEPPMLRLSNAAIALSNGVGKPFTQLDDIKITSITFDTCTATTGNFGTMHIRTSRPFSTDELRVGDMITVYSPGITQLTSDPSCTPILSQFLQILDSNNVFVKEVNISNYPGLPLVEVGYSFNALLKTQGFSNVLTTYSTLSSLVFGGTLQSNASLQPYIAFEGMSGFTQTFSEPYPLPMMNINMQATYTLEVTTLHPDVSKLKKIIPT